MSWLDNLLNAVTPHPGNWNVGGVKLPDFRVTEGLGSLVGVNAPKTSQGGSDWLPNGTSSGQIQGTTTTAPNSTPYGPAYDPTLALKTKTANTNGVTGTTSSGSDNSNLVNIAQQGKNSALQDIQDRIAMIKDIASRNIGTAGDVRNEIVGNIGSTYGNLINRAGQAKESSLANLGQEDVNVQNQYGRVEGTARRAIESALTRNRMLARSMNRLGGSFYNDQQANTNETGARSIADIGTELAGKRAGIGTRMTDTKNYFEATAQDLANEQGTLTSQADQEYQKQVSAASDMERAYGIDSTEAAAQAEQQYQSRLDQINEYIQNKATTLAGIASNAAAKEGAITGYQPVDSTLSGILNNTSGLNKATSDISGLGSGFSAQPTGSSNYLGFAGQTPTAYELLQKRLGNLFA